MQEVTKDDSQAVANDDTQEEADPDFDHFSEMPCFQKYFLI